MSLFDIDVGRDICELLPSIVPLGFPSEVRGPYNQAEAPVMYRSS